MVQYILTEEEYSSLRKKIKDSEDLPSKKKLQEFCTFVADNMPITVDKGTWWKDTPWGCIITKGKEPDPEEWYCDKCPSKNICPYPYKHWSQ